MKSVVVNRLILAFVATGVLANSIAATDEDWQIRRLFAPTTAQQAAERKGRIVIYDGLHERDLERALEQQFHPGP